MNRNSVRLTVVSLACALVLAAWCGLGRAQGKPSDTARDVVDQVLRNAGKPLGRDLESWSRSVIERALKREGRKAPGSPRLLPAEGHAGRLAASLSGRLGGPEVMVFMSLSAPAESWRQWSREAARVGAPLGAPLVLRGLGPGGLQTTVKRIGAYLDREAGAAIDPRLFRLFDITVIPAVVVVPGGVPPCRSRGCFSDAAPPHDRIAGNMGLEAALEAVASEGGPGRATARRGLAILRGHSP